MNQAEEEPTRGETEGAIFDIPASIRVQATTGVTAWDEIYTDQIRYLKSTKALCTSQTCLQRHMLYMKTQGVKISKFCEGAPKDVPKTTIDCPDCFHALWWRPTFDTKYFTDNRSGTIQ